MVSPNVFHHSPIYSIIYQRSVLLLLVHTLGIVVFLGKFLVSEKLGVHSSCGHILCPLGLLDAVGVSLVRRVMRTRVLLLLVGANEKVEGSDEVKWEMG